MIYVFVAPGFEEIEAISTVDILRRAGAAVNTVGIGGKTVAGSHGIPVNCDMSEADFIPDERLEAVVLPGGMPGTINLEKSDTVRAAIRYAYDNDKYICAICAAPSVFGHMGLLKGRSAVCFPGMESELSGAVVPDKFVCTDGKIITAKGPGASIAFGLEIARHTTGADVDAIKESLQCP
ncbi:MAG: DJ-1/PfpI family protein [Clostridiales bacterium]|nr:DJ-1/PfpI family protein [Clostridiales bacterium]